MERTHNLEKGNTKMFNWNITIFLLAFFELMSFYEVFNTSTSMYIAKYFFFMLFVFIMYRRTKYIGLGNKGIVLFTVTLIIVGMFNLAYIINDPLYTRSDYLESISNILLYIVVGVLSVYLFPKIPLSKFKTILFLFLIALLVVVTIPALIGVGDPLAYNYSGGRKRFLGTFNNPNELSQFSLIGVFISMRLWSLYKGRVKKSFFLFMILSSAYLIFLSDSRAGMLVAILAICVWIVINLYRFLQLNVFISFVTFVSVIPLLAVLYIINTNSFININLNELSSGRIKIWSNTFSGTWQEFLFGTGQIAGKGVHNGFFEIYKFFGATGLFVWLLIIFGLLIKKIKSVNRKNFSSLIGVGIVVLFMAYHMFEGGMVSVANLASVYFWLELAQRDKQQEHIAN